MLGFCVFVSIPHRFRNVRWLSRPFIWLNFAPSHFSRRVLAAFSFNVAFACMPRPLRSPLFLLFAVIALHYDVDLSDSDKEVALICYGYLHLAICTTGRSLSFDALGRALPVRQRNNAAYEHMTYTVILLRFFRFAPYSTNLLLATETCECAFASSYADSYTCNDVPACAKPTNCSFVTVVCMSDVRSHYTRLLTSLALSLFRGF